MKSIAAAEVALVFPNGSKALTYVDHLPRTGDTVRWAVGHRVTWTVSDVIHTLYPHNQRGEIDIHLIPQESDA